MHITVFHCLGGSFQITASYWTPAQIPYRFSERKIIFRALLITLLLQQLTAIFNFNILEMSFSHCFSKCWITGSLIKGFKVYISCFLFFLFREEEKKKSLSSPCSPARTIDHVPLVFFSDIQAPVPFTEGDGFLLDTVSLTDK